MRANSTGRPRRSYLAGFLALFLLCSPVAALKMMFTLRYTQTGAAGSYIGAKLKLERKSSPQPIEVTRPLVIRKAFAVRSAASFLGGLRDLANRFERSAPAVLRPQTSLRDPVYLQIFLPSTPQNPVFPPSDPVPPAS